MSKPRSKPKYSHVESVGALFDKLSLTAPAASDWLAALHQRALKKDANWKADADAYVHGLIAAGAMTPETAAAWRVDLALCGGSNPRGWKFLLPIAWVAIVATATMTSYALASDTASLAVLGVLAAVAGGQWARTEPWLDRRNNPRQGRLEKPVMIGACALIAMAAIYYIPPVVGLATQYVSIKQFNADRAAFIIAPQGFPLLQKLAREQYGIEVVLGDADQSWASTTLKLPNASAASIAIGPGYCHLNIYRANLLRTFDPVGHVDEGLWVQGIMMHEFAHCLDMSRDMPAFGQQTIGTHSLAPVDATEAKDIPGLLQAGTTQATQLWHEAVADTFAVGYWKLTTPAAAGDLVASLRRKRTDAPSDTTHATMCWIDYAEKAAQPASMTDLFTWADHLRATAPCDLPMLKPKKYTRLQQWVRELAKSVGVTVR